MAAVAGGAIPRGAGAASFRPSGPTRARVGKSEPVDAHRRGTNWLRNTCRLEGRTVRAGLPDLEAQPRPVAARRPGAALPADPPRRPAHSGIAVGWNRRRFWPKSSEAINGVLASLATVTVRLTSMPSSSEAACRSSLGSRGAPPPAERPAGPVFGRELHPPASAHRRT